MDELIRQLRYFGHWHRSVSVFVGLVMFVGLIPDDASAASGGTRISEVKRDPSVSGREFDKKRTEVRNDAAVDWRPEAGKVPARTFTTLVTDTRDRLPKQAPLATEDSGLRKPTAVQTGVVKARQVSQAQPRQGVRINGRAAERETADVGTAVQIQVKDATAARKAGVQGLLLTAAPARDGLDTRSFRLGRDRA